MQTITGAARRRARLGKLKHANLIAVSSSASGESNERDSSKIPFHIVATIIGGATGRFAAPVTYDLLMAGRLSCNNRLCTGAQSMTSDWEILLKSLLTEKGGSSSFDEEFVELQNRVNQVNKNEKELFLFKSLIDQIPDLLFVKDRAGKFVIANAAVTRAYGFQNDGLIGKSDHDLHPIELADEFSKHEQQIIDSGTPQFNMQESFSNSEGVTKWYSTTKVPLRDHHEGVTVGLIGIARDVTERRQMEEQLVHMAHYDALTQLPNRTLFLDRLNAALSDRREKNNTVSLLYIDLDGFKMINDTAGHHTGDILLQKVSNRLREIFEDGNTVARLGGDEFAAIQIFNNDQGRETSMCLAERIIEALILPHDIQGHVITVGATIGIAIAPEDDDNPDALLRDADIALYQAKAERRGAIRFFEPEMSTRVKARNVLENDLRKALKSNSFELYYQPMVDLASNEVCGFEALIRWNHPEQGLITPLDFIGIAEETGLIIPIGKWILHEACRQAALWPESIKVAVNLSPVQFKSENLLQDVVLALSTSLLSPRRLELEITESVFLFDSDTNLELLKKVRKLGVEISLDDFGTGYSSLSYLRLFPFNKIKIDRSFVSDLDANPGCLAIIRAVSHLASDLGMKTIAEGIETKEQLNKLIAEGCQEGQGYLFSRPLPADKATSLIGSLPRASIAA